MTATETLSDRQQAALTCVRHCPHMEDCRADPLACTLRLNYQYNWQPQHVVVRRRSPHRRPSWWRRNRADLACYAVVWAAIVYVSWHLAAAIVEGRLAVPGLR